MIGQTEVSECKMWDSVSADPGQSRMWVKRMGTLSATEQLVTG